LLWAGTPAVALQLARDKEIELCTSRALIRELREVLQRPKFATAIRKTGRSAMELIADYRRVVKQVPVRRLRRRIARDAADDRVLACAIAARAALIVSGDRDLLSLTIVEGVEVVTPGALARHFPRPETGS